MTMFNIKGLTYLDHNATTPLKTEARDAMFDAVSFPGNASSVHKMGREARRRIEEARQKIAAFLNAGPKAVVIFTSGATEANNLVLKGCGAERILVSAIEHPSVLNAVPHREIIPVLKSGVVDVDALDKMLEGNGRQTLISVMAVNNETGIIQPVDKVVEIAKRRGALVHTDAVQAAGKIPLDLQKLGVDYLSLSAHKIGGPQGTGCLVLSNCVSVKPEILGGGQEKNMRAGTENLAGIAGFGVAAEMATRDLEKFHKLSVFRDRIETELKRISPESNFFGQGVSRIPNTTMFSLSGFSSETLMIAFDLEGICVSGGSACSSGTVKTSPVLKAMGVDDAEASSALRVSLGWNSTEKDADDFIRVWTKIYGRMKAR